MRYENHFKQENIEEAQAEVKCIENLFRLSKLNIEAGKFEQANHRVAEILNSIKRLEQLNETKRNDDEFKKYVKQLLNNQITNQNLMVYFNE